MGQLQIDKAGLDGLLQPDQQAGQTLEGDSKQPGRKKKTATKNPDIVTEFDKLCSDGKVSFEHGGLTAAAKTLHEEFSDYELETIRKIIQPHYHEAKKHHEK